MLFSFFQSLLENDLRNACLGEASPAIYAAFQAKDIRQIIIAAMSWITNANSSDAWGKHYKYFPKPEEVISKEFKITKQFINLQTMEEKLMSKDSVFDLFSDSLVQEVERIENEETEHPNEDQEQPNQQIQNEPPQMVFQLRRPGVPNYQPYTTEN